MAKIANLFSEEGHYFSGKIEKLERGETMPKLICISAANIRHKPRGTSYQICELVRHMATEINPGITCEIIPLVNYDFSPCIGCGICYKAGQCYSNDDFNHVLDSVNRADGLVIVSPHYAPIPSKLAMFLEKAEQIAFLPRFHDDSRRSLLYGKPVGIIGHGGGTEEIMKGYETVVLRTIANALMYPIDMDIVRIGSVPGVIFPVAEVQRKTDILFPLQEYDMEDIKKRITPLVKEVLNRMVP